MNKVTYVLIKSGMPQHIPQAVNNRSQTIGSAMYEKRYNGHVFRVPREKWEGTPAQKGLEYDLLRPSMMRSGLWRVRVEIEADAESPEAKLADELDQVKADLAAAEARVEMLEIQLAEATQARGHAGVGPQTIIDPSGNVLTDDGNLSYVSPEPASEPPAPEPEPDTPEAVLAAHRARLTALGKNAPKFADLLAEAKEQNAAGASIDEGIISKQGFIDALLNWYATK